MPAASAPRRALQHGAVRPGASPAPGATPDQAGSHLTHPAVHSPPRSTHSPARSSTRSPRHTRHVAPAASPPAAPHTSSPVHTTAAPSAANSAGSIAGASERASSPAAAQMRDMATFARDAFADARPAGARALPPQIARASSPQQLAAGLRLLLAEGAGSTGAATGAQPWARLSTSRTFC